MKTAATPAIVRAVKLRLIIVLVLLAASAAAAWWWSRPHQAAGQAAYRHTEAILAFGPRPPASPALAKVRAYLTDELKKSGWVCGEQSFERITPQGTVRFTNLRARLDTGTDTWQRRVEGILGAHVDSKDIKNRKFVGADDAASACAAMLEIARQFTAQDKRKAALLELVFFDGEEAFNEHMTLQDGLYGSRHYANFWREREDKPRFGIVLDMIGHRDLSIRMPADSPAFLRDAVLAAAKQENGAEHFGMAPNEILDDHTPLNLAGIPTIDIIGDFANDHWWHTERDDLSLISPASLDLSIRVTLRTLASQIR